jgi:hypothetical protein
MTDPGPHGPPVTRPEPVFQAIPLHPVPSSAIPSQAEPSQAVPSQAAPPKVVPSQAALFREQRETAGGDEGPLLADAGDLRAGWQRVKAGFVDNPRGSVAEAATVVEEAIRMLVAELRARQDRIRDTWDSDGQGGDTEALRQALLTYQSLFRYITSQ